MKVYGQITYVAITVLITSRPFLAVEVYQFTKSSASDVIESQSITLVCKYNRSVSTSTGPATTTWFRYRNDREERVGSVQDGHPYIENDHADRFQVDQNGNLVINITRYDAGMYKCEVMIYDDTPKRSEETLDITVYYADKPTIEMPSYVMIGNVIEIICNISDAHPQPLLQIYNAQNQTVKFSNGFFTKKATKHDAGEYYCAARNKAGNKTSDSRKLTVYFIEIPKLVIMNATRENSYIIKCQVFASVPVPELYIMHDNKTIKATTGLNLTYHLKEATKDDEGYYQCIAQNLAGETNSEIQKLVVDTRSSTGDSTTEARVTDEETNILTEYLRNVLISSAFVVSAVLIVVVIAYCRLRKKNRGGTQESEKLSKMSTGFGLGLLLHKDCCCKVPVCAGVPTSQNSEKLETRQHETNNTAVIGLQYEKNPNQVTSPRQTLSRNTEDLVYADLHFQNCPGRCARIKRVVENTVYSSVVH